MSRLFYSFAFVCLLAGVGLIASCTAERTFHSPPHDLVSGMSSGTISIASPISLEFAIPVRQILQGQESKVIQVRPFVDGAFSWSDDRTLIFKPKALFTPDTRYVLAFSAKPVKQQLSVATDFDLVVHTMRQEIKVEITDFEAQSDGSVRIAGELKTADVAGKDDIEKTVWLQGVQAPLRWEHHLADRRSTFESAPVKRGSSPTNVSLVWDGGAIGAREKAEKKLVIPGSGDFQLLDSRSVNGDEEYVDLQFSDPVDPRQDLRGFIVNAEGRDLKLSVRGNAVRVWNPDGWKRNNTLIVHAGIKSQNQKRLVADIRRAADFPNKLPEVRFASKGVILPTSQGLTVPIESMNLSGVGVEVIRVWRDNVTQFLQVNQLDGNNEITRVGSVVWHDTIHFDWKPEYTDKWQRRALDLSPLVSKYPGGMYRIRLTFTPEFVKYPGAESLVLKEKAARSDVADGADMSWWDFADQYYGDDDVGDYDQRKNPANPAYYRKFYDHDINVYRNVIVSDIGLVAQRSTNGALHVLVTDLKEATPAAGVPVSVLNYQRQVLAKGTSDADGQIKFAKLSDQPYFLEAKRGEQDGWLRMADGESLVLSAFDTAGEALEKGLNGFLYGERGVWRPGDTMHLTFILNDPNKQFPENHPVKLTLYDPKGQARTSLVNTKGTNGFYYFEPATAPSDPTGTWVANVEAGGASFSKNLKVETVIPNRLKIDLTLQKQNEAVSGAVAGTVGASWLTGAPAPGLKVSIKAGFTATTTRFPGEWSNYQFDDVSRSFSFEPIAAFDGNLDGNAKANFKAPNFSFPDGAPGKLRLALDTRVFEPSGAFSSDSYSVDYNPYSQYVGIQVPKGDVARGMLLTDTDHVVKVALLDTNGKPVPSGRVSLDVYKVEWRWWWQGSEDSSDAEHQNAENRRAIAHDEANVVDGRATVKFRVAYPEWGRYLVKVSDKAKGHSASSYVYIDWPGWAGRSMDQGPGAAPVLLVSADKPKYAVGEPITLNIPGNDKARAYVSVESNGLIVKSEWVKLTGATTAYTIRATSSMAPNVYAHVILFQPHLQTANDLPIRMYGVVPLLVEDPQSHLVPKIQSEDSFKPESTVKIRVSEVNGRPMTYTLALVDEGLLSLTRYTAPDPWTTFYKKQASLVRTWDLFNYVAGAYAGKLDSLFAIGGSEDLANNARKKQNRFPPVVVYLPPQNLAAGETKEQELTLPPYVGAVRIMVVAGRDGAFGAAEKSVTVKQDLMVLGTLPRVLSPSERSEVPVTVFWTGPVPQAVTVRLSPNGAVLADGPTEQLVRFDAQGDKTVAFRVKTKSTIGAAIVKINAADSIGHAVSQTVVLDVRQTAAEQTEVRSAAIKPGASWTDATVKLFGTDGTNKVRLELSSLPPMDLGKRLDYLLAYPHGCIEQTTSAAFPQLYLPDLLELRPDQKAAVTRNITAAIERLKGFQTSSGGFAYWQGGGNADDWGSSYAGHFIIEARRAGYAVPDSMLNAWIGYQQKTANAWKSGTSQAESWYSLEQAYRLYGLALAGAPELGAMNRLRELNLPDAARWRLAAAYKLAGLDGQARELVSKANWRIKPYHELAYSYGSDLRDRAMILETMLLLDMEGDIESIVNDISSRLSSQNWLSTQETAYSLIAMSRLAGWGSGRSTGLNVDGRWSGQAIEPVESKRTLVLRDLPVTGSEGTVTLNNKGAGVVFARLILSGVPPLGKETEVSNGLKTTVRWFDANGKPLGMANDPTKALLSWLLPKTGVVAEPNFKPGVDLSVEVTVTNTSKAQNYQGLALSLLLPAGLEIQNPRLQANQKDSAKAAAFDFQDIRDDRVYTYFSLRPGESKVFRTTATTAYSGKYYVPAVRVEAMYDATINSLVPGQWMSIGDAYAAKP